MCFCRRHDGPLGKLVDFGNTRLQVVGYIESLSSRSLVHYRLVALGSYNHNLFMTLSRKSVSSRLSWFPDDTSDALFFRDTYKELKRVFFRRVDMLGVEYGSFCAYKDSPGPSVRHNLMILERIKQKIDHCRSLGSIKKG